MLNLNTGSLRENLKPYLTILTLVKDFSARSHCWLIKLDLQQLSVEQYNYQQSFGHNILVLKLSLFSLVTILCILLLTMPKPTIDTGNGAIAHDNNTI